MADDVTLNTGSGGDVIGADDISSVKYQRIKLIHGVNGTNDGDVALTNPLPVRSFVYPVTVQTDMTRQAADTTQYGANDAMSNSTSAPTSGGFTFTGAARVSGGSGIITDATFSTDADVATKLSAELWLFNQAVTNINDNAAFAVSDAEIKTCVGVIPFTMYDAGNNGFAHASGLSIMFTCVGTANLRFLYRVRNAYTPVGSEVITATLKILQLD
jgi:hypothetical protein